VKSKGAPAARRLGALPPALRRRLIRRVAITSVLTVIAIVVGYFLLPFAGEQGVALFLRTILGVAVVVVALGWQVHSISVAEYPQLRLVEGFALIVPLVLVSFAGTYLAISATDLTAFSEELDHVGALYLSMTTMTTTGFGDIAARTQTARIVVMMQMVSTVLAIGAGTRVAFSVVGERLRDPERADGAPAGSVEGGEGE
jgi:voltage-gated potassium channel